MKRVEGGGGHRASEGHGKGLDRGPLILQLPAQQPNTTHRSGSCSNTTPRTADGRCP
jgi:hypothetical protein